MSVEKKPSKVNLPEYEFNKLKIGLFEGETIVVNNEIGVTYLPDARAELGAMFVVRPENMRMRLEYKNGKRWDAPVYQNSLRMAGKMIDLRDNFYRVILGAGKYVLIHKVGISSKGYALALNVYSPLTLTKGPINEYSLDNLRESLQTLHLAR